MLARQTVLAEAGGRPRKAWWSATRGGGLPLLEAFSRNTASELRNAGYDVTALFGKRGNRDGAPQLLPEQGPLPLGGAPQHAHQRLGLPVVGLSRCRRRWCSCKAAWP